MSRTRQDVERVIAATTNFDKDELVDKSLDDLQFITDVLGHCDADVDADEISKAIANLNNDD